MIYKLQDMKNRVKWAYQRIVRGYDDRLHWDLAEYLDPMIVAQARYLRDYSVGHPSSITQKKWNKVLDTIIKGFGEEPDAYHSKAWKKYRKEREKALVLLAFYWDNLWD